MNQDKLPTRFFEDACQTLINHLDLPYRLHRAVSCGTILDPDANEPHYVSKTFLTYFVPDGDVWVEFVEESGKTLKFIYINGVEVKINGKTCDRAFEKR